MDSRGPEPTCCSHITRYIYNIQPISEVAWGFFEKRVSSRGGVQNPRPGATNLKDANSESESRARACCWPLRLSRPARAGPKNSLTLHWQASESESQIDACACACAAEGRGNVVIYRGIDQFQGDDNGHVGRPCEVSLAPPYPELFASYGASAVTRTSGRGHVAEAKTNVIEASGFLIRVSKETLLTLNVHFCVQRPAQRC
jgi:hypothetical protein